MTSSGEIDRAAARRLAEALFDAAEHAVLVILDLSGVTLMDSHGLRAILTANAWLRRADCRLALVPGPPAVHRVFELAGTDGVLEFVPAPNTGDREPREAAGRAS